MNAERRCFSIGLCIMYIDEALFRHVLTLFIFCFYVTTLTLKIRWGLAPSDWANVCNQVKPFFYQRLPLEQIIVYCNVTRSMFCL